MQQRHRRGCPPGRRDDVGEFTFFVEKFIQSQSNAVRLDNEDAHVVEFVEERSRLLDEERHPPFHPIEQLTGRDSIKDFSSPRPLDDQSLTSSTRDFARQPFASRSDEGPIKIVQ